MLGERARSFYELSDGVVQLLDISFERVRGCCGRGGMAVLFDGGDAMDDVGHEGS